MADHGKNWQETAGSNVAAADKAAICIKMRIEGFTYPEISDYVGIAQSQCYSYVKQYLDRKKGENMELAGELINLELDRLDKMFQKSYKLLENGDTDEIPKLLRVMERRDKLLGLAAPIKVAPTTPDGEKPYEPKAVIDPSKLTTAELIALKAAIVNVDVPEEGSVYVGAEQD